MAIRRIHWFKTLVVLASIFSIMSAANGVPGQQWKLHPGTKPAEVEPSKGEQSIEKMIRKCEAFLKANRLPSPAGIVPNIDRSFFSGRRSPYCIVRFDLTYSFSINAITGKLFTFDFGKRNDEILHGRIQKKPLSIPNEAAARNYVLKLAKRLGFDGNYVLDRFQCDFSKSRKNAANISARFVGRRYGYSLGNLDRGDIVIDPQDGALLGFGAPLDVPIKVESHTLKLSERQARTLSDQAAQKYGVGTYRRGYIVDIAGLKYGDRLKPSKNKSILQLVLPNGKFGGPNYGERNNPRRVRLAWILWYPGDEAVWIDAGNGEVLGGLSKLND